MSCSHSEEEDYTECEEQEAVPLETDLGDNIAVERHASRGNILIMEKEKHCPDRCRLHTNNCNRMRLGAAFISVMPPG